MGFRQLLLGASCPSPGACALRSLKSNKQAWAFAGRLVTLLLLSRARVFALDLSRSGFRATCRPGVGGRVRGLARLRRRANPWPGRMVHHACVRIRSDVVPEELYLRFRPRTSVRGSPGSRPSVLRTLSAAAGQSSAPRWPYIDIHRICFRGVASWGEVAAWTREQR